jgi:hypothetical protein
MASLIVLKLIAMFSLLGAMIVGGVRYFVQSGRVFDSAEVEALRSVLRDALPTIRKGNIQRNSAIYYLQASIFEYDMHPLFMLLDAEELAVFEPFIDARIAAASTPGTERAALAKFKERMIRQELWPKQAKPLISSGNDAG